MIYAYIVRVSCTLDMDYLCLFIVEDLADLSC